MYEAKGLTKRCNPSIHIRRVPEVSAHSGHTAGTTSFFNLFNCQHSTKYGSNWSALPSGGLPYPLGENYGHVLPTGGPTVGTVSQ